MNVTWKLLWFKKWLIYKIFLFLFLFLWSFGHPVFFSSIPCTKIYTIVTLSHVYWAYKDHKTCISNHKVWIFPHFIGSHARMIFIYKSNQARFWRQAHLDTCFLLTFLQEHRGSKYTLFVEIFARTNFHAEPQFARNCAKISTDFLHFCAQKKIRDKFSQNLPLFFVCIAI